MTRSGPSGGGLAVATYHADHRPRRRRSLVLIHAIRMAPPIAAATAVAAVAMPATAIGWAAALGSRRVPRGIDRLVSGAHAYHARVNGSLYLLAEPRPPLTGRSGPHPVQLRIARRSGPIDRRDAVRRLAATPAILATDVVLGVGVLLGSGVAAATIVGTGRMPSSLHRVIAFGTSYHARSSAYLALISDVPPRLRERDPATGRPLTPGSGGA